MDASITGELGQRAWTPSHLLKEHHCIKMAETLKLLLWYNFQSGFEGIKGAEIKYNIHIYVFIA